MSNSHNIQTYVRIRPSNSLSGGSACPKVIEPASILIHNLPFSFDHVGDINTSQKDVFDSVGMPLCDHALEGFNVTLFCYGQTGSGKTWTMQGPLGTNLEDSSTTEDRGLIQRFFEYIFEKQSSTSKQLNDKNTKIEYLNKVSSFVEIYNEIVHDLLDLSNKKALREDLTNGVFVSGATEMTIESAEDSARILEEGARNRTTACTDMNERSSRSHSILTLTIQTKTTKNGLTVVKEAKVNLVDLAGSERQKSANTQGQRLKEGSHINKSLLALGKCINALVDIGNGKIRHVHYRDSKLTWMLKDSLGGNSKSTLIATITSDPISVAESISTLRFANRAKLVKNKAHINQNWEATSIKNLQDEIKRLEQLIGSGVALQTSGGLQPTFKFEFNLLSSLQTQLSCVTEREKRQRNVLGKFEELIKKKDLQLQNEHMLNRFKDDQIQRLRKSTTGTDSTGTGEESVQFVDELKKEIEFLKTCLSHQNTDTLQQATRNMVLQEEITNLNSLISNFEGTESMNSFLANKEAEWAQRVVEFDLERVQLNKIIDDLNGQEAIVNLKIEIESLNRDREKLKDEIKRAENRFEVDFEEKISLMADIEDKNQCICDLEILVDSQAEELKTNSLSILELKEKLKSEREDETEDSSAVQLEMALTEITSLKEELKTVRDLQQKSTRSERKSRRISDYASEKESLLRETIESLTAKNAQLEQKLTDNIDLSTKANNLDSLLKESSILCHGLKSRLSKAEGESEELLTNLETAQNDCELFQQTISVLESRILELSNDNAVVSQEKIYLEQSLYSALKNVTAGDEKEVARRVETIDKKWKDKLEEEVRNKEKMAADNLVHLSELVAKLNDSRAQVTQFESDIELLRENLANYEQMQVYSESLEEKLILFEQREIESNNNIKKELELAQKELLINKQNLSLLDEEKLELVLENSTLTSKLSTSESEVREKNSIVERLKMDTAMMEDDLNEMMMLHEKSSEEIKQLQQQKTKIIQPLLIDVAIETESVSVDAYDLLQIKFLEIEKISLLNSERFILQDAELKRVCEENENLMKSNHKQKLQYMVQLKKEHNQLTNENRVLKEENRDLKRICGEDKEN